MRPTEVLTAEHRVIEQVLDCLERIVQSCRSTGRVDQDAAHKALDFFRNFADRCHHGKEEVHLFPAMEAQGFPRQGGPTGVMLTEHEQGRAAVQGMARSLEEAETGRADAARQFADYGEAYIDLLRQHIDKEDHCLFPMADEALSSEDQKSLLEAFEKVETREMEEGTHEKYLAIAQELSERLGVPWRVSTSQAAARRGCCHGDSGNR
jgi:hemerythrin-like domain-containing protein